MNDASDNPAPASATSPLPSPQVERSHYDFHRYVGKARWASLWHQLDEVLALAPREALELGPGPGVFKRVAGLFGVPVETLDLDPALQPDHVGSATALPFADGRYDLVCAFQMLEHLPYEQSLRAFEEMVRVARRHVVISLPDDRRYWRFSFHWPRRGNVDWLMPRPRLRPRPNRFDGEHYWEISQQGYSLEKVSADLAARCPLVKTYLVPELPNHRFFVFRRPGA